MIAHVIRSFSPDRFPLMTRPSYRRELWVSAMLPAAMALIEGGVVGVLAAKVFNASAAQIAALTAAPMFAQLTSFFWAQVARGRRKIPLIANLMRGALLCIALIAAAPANPFGAWMITALVIAARCLAAGVITIRSTIWRHNYPRAIRGRITSRFAVLMSIALMVTPLLASALLDYDARSFRVLYPLAALIGAFAAMQYARIRMRHEEDLLRHERRPDAEPRVHDDAQAVWTYDEHDRPRRMRRPSRLFTVLRDDPDFRQYMTWQMCAGIANMMLQPVVVLIVADLTQDLSRGFLIAFTITACLPALASAISVALWARAFDAMHITQFRVRQSHLWWSSQVVLFAGAMSGSVATTLIVFAIGRTMLGVAMGGGSLAWQLGHHDFAKRHHATEYMGVHQTLVGTRGAFAPFLGVALYHLIGPYVFAVAATLAITATVGFYNMSRRFTGVALAAD